MAFFFSFLFFSISLLFLIIASISDLKSRIVSNKLNYSMLALGLLLHAVQAVVESNLQILYFTLAAVVLTFLGSFLLWKLGVWAGGDVKLFTALTALVPLNPAVIPQVLGYAQGIFQPLNLPIFPLTLFIFSIFSMMPLGMLISINGILKNKKLKTKVWLEVKQLLASALFFSLAIAGLEAVFLKLQFNVLLIFVPLLLLALLPKRVRAFVSVLLFAIGFYITIFQVLQDFFLVFASLALVSLFLKLFFVSRKEVLIIEKKISKLEEGEIAAETILECKGRIKRFAGIGFSETFKYLKSNNLAALLEALKPKGRIIADRHSAAGLTLEELKELKSLVKGKKLEDRIKVKLSTAFVPGVLIAFLILAFASDVFWRLLFP